MVDDIKYVCMLWRVGCTKGKVSNCLFQLPMESGVLTRRVFEHSNNASCCHCSKSLGIGHNSACAACLNMGTCRCVAGMLRPIALLRQHQDFMMQADLATYQDAMPGVNDIRARSMQIQTSC